MVDKVPSQLDEQELKEQMDVEIPEAIEVEETPENVEIVEESVTMETITTVDPVSGEEVVQEIPAMYDITIRRVKAKNQLFCNRSTKVLSGKQKRRFGVCFRKINRTPRNQFPVFI